MDAKRLGKFIRDRRKKLRLSQNFIADKLGYNKQIISNWERGLSSPSMSCWDDLMSLLEIDINGLMSCRVINKIQGRHFDDNKFSSNLLYLRQKNNLTQIDLANKINANNKTISSWENGLSLPSIDMFVTLCDVFKTSYAKLFYADNEIEDDELLITPKSKKKWMILTSSLVVALAVGLGVGLPLALSGHNNNPVVNPNGGDNNPGGGDNNPPIVNYTLSLNKHTYNLYLDQSGSLIATTIPQGAVVGWTSSDTSIVTVSDSGVLTPHKNGTSLVTAYLKTNSKVYDVCEVRVKYRTTQDYASFVPMDRETMEFYSPNEKVTASFYFEDKKTVIYQEMFEKDDPFSYNFDIPTFGPYKGWNYEFLGWDYTYDGVVDELPSTITTDMNFVAVYNKTPTSEIDFINCKDGKSTFIEGCNEAYKTMIIPSSAYDSIIEPSEQYNSAKSSDNHINDQVVENIIPMRGIQTFEDFSTGYSSDSSNIKYVRYQDSIINTSIKLPKVTVNSGIIYGSIDARVFEKGVTNDKLLIRNALSISNHAFAGCNSIKTMFLDGKESVNFANNSLVGLTSLEYLHHDKLQINTNLSEFANTSVQYHDLRWTAYVYDQNNPEKYVFSSSSDPITLLMGGFETESLVKMLDQGHQYNVLVGYGYGVPNGFHIPDDANTFTNVDFFEYSEIEIDHGWHFNSNGFPTSVY